MPAIKRAKGENKMVEIISRITNNETAMSAIIFLSGHKAGGYGVSLIDDDSGMSAGSYHGFQSMDAAISKAKIIAGV